MTAEPLPFTAAGRLLDFMRQADQPGLINLAAGVPGPDALPLETLQAAFTRGFQADGAAMLAYHHPEGDLPLRALVAARLGQRGDAVKPEQLVTVTGCTQALQLMLSLLVSPGDIVACEAPAYYGMLELLSVMGARVLPLPVRGETGIDPAEAEALLERWRPRCLIVCSTLSNPSGATLPDATRQALVEICRRTGTRIIDDDIYGELLEGGAPRPLRAWDPEGAVVSYVTSFCKSVAPGLRVGVCIPGPEWHERFADRKCQQDLHSAVVAEVALREFLRAGDFDPHLEKLRVRNRRRRAIALEAITRSFPTGTQVHPPRGGYMLWAELPAKFDLKALATAAREERVVFGADRVFFTAPPEKSCLRLNCAKASEQELVLGIETLGRLLGPA